ncbi:uncharacterized protein LOC133171854 [Saccostrea echinata]|uniref:uncharacterized protein LOC133171854 n=1 Tax=Saccostrea echinata TaxID=191078 RepID=UPI002A82A707|nr:uncharacterized protein LOC133171854 [Saccostrea echinata]
MIVKNALAPQLHKEVVQNCRTKPFSLACDESNDRNSEKTLAIFVRYFDNQAVTQFLDMPICNVGTSQNIFDHLEQVFINNNIPWENLIAFSSDNCNVMMGKKNSVMTKIKEMQPHVFDIGCICHLANLCTMAGVKSLSLPVDDLLVDVYYHFHHSALRKETYKEYLDFCDVDPSKLLKHCSTRWLSLEKCVKRLLHHWPALTSYFNSHSDVEKPGRVKRVAELLRSHEMRMTFHFLGYVLEPLNEFNTTFQADESRIGYLGEEIHKLLRKFLGRFIKAGIIKNSKDLISVDFQNPENQLQDNILAVGILTRFYIAENDEDIPPVDLAIFFQNVRGFYCAITKKMLKHFPFKDPVVNNLGFLNPHRREETSLQSIVEIARRFPAIVQEKDFPKLEEEYLDFSVSPDCDLPNFEKGQTRIDSFWGEMGKITNKVSGTPRFPILNKIAQSMCCIPNSNADCERVFSLVRKIQTEQRASMDNQTLCSLLCAKINCKEECHQVKPSKDTLKLTKSAAYN